MTAVSEEHADLVEAKKARLTARRSTPPNLLDARQDDPEVESEARSLFDRRRAKSDAEEFERARRDAQRIVNRRRRAMRAALPETWLPAFTAARMTGLALVWPGCPVDPRIGIPLAEIGFSVDGDGIWFRPERRDRQFVMSPAVRLGGSRFAIRSGKDWATIEVPALDGGVDVFARSVRPSSSQWSLHVLGVLQRAGLKLGSVVVSGVRDDDEERTPASEFAGLWLCGTFAGALQRGPLAKVTDRPGTLDRELGSAEERQTLGEVLGRLPADLRGRNR